VLASTPGVEAPWVKRNFAPAQYAASAGSDRINWAALRPGMFQALDVAVAVAVTVCRAVSGDPAARAQRSGDAVEVVARPTVALDHRHLDQLPAEGGRHREERNGGLGRQSHGGTGRGEVLDRRLQAGDDVGEGVIHSAGTAQP
jgi:hypothetical protein